MENIEFLYSPSHFFQTLTKHLKSAENVFISTLAFSHEDKNSKQILNILKWRKQKNKPTIIIIDKYRACRLQSFLDTLYEYNIEDMFVLYDTSTYNLLPPFLQEMFSVLHSKLYVFDSKILITGANLKDTYFVDTIDRYIFFESQSLTAHIIKDYFKKNQQLAIFEQPNLLKVYNSTIKSYVHKFEREDEISILTSLLEIPYKEIFMSTPYPNFSDKHISLLANKKMNIITASPHNSTFKFDSVMEKYVIESYTQSVINLMDEMKNSTFYEYVNEDYKFHTKGFWLFGEDFVCSIVGSTNFNMRSIFRDIECNFLVISGDKRMIDEYRREIEGFMMQSKLMVKEEIMMRQVSVVSKMIKYFGHRYL